MNRRRFISLLGLVPFAGIIAKRMITEPDVTVGGKVVPGLTLAKLIAARKLLNSNDYMGFKFVRTEGPMQGPPHFAVRQQTNCRQDMNYAWQVLTRVSMNGKEELIFVTLWDEDEDMSKALDTTTADAIERTRRYWAARDRWQRKAREANWRTGRFTWDMV